VDHVQGLAKLQGLLSNAITVGHPETIELLKGNDRISIYAEIPAQGISIEMPQVAFQQAVNEGSQLKLGSLTLDVWNTPGHTNSQLSLKMGELLFSGDNLFRDGGVGNIDAHHGSDIPDFISSLNRIKNCDAKWLLPSHGPIFRKDPKMIQQTIDRLETYLHMSDFGTCATDWPLLEEWDLELLKGFDAEAAS
jgi:glyoxylase-like metal-dependent hydrolase (beta-lactamase superfamily II)